MLSPRACLSLKLSFLRCLPRPLPPLAGAALHDGFAISLDNYFNNTQSPERLPFVSAVNTKEWYCRLRFVPRSCALPSSLSLLYVRAYGG